MANQYSNYTLAPYVSQYVNPYSVEVNTVLRQRWDQNKGNKDKIDATIGSWDTLPGDAHLVDKAKQQIKDKLNTFSSNGNYEDAGLAISETMVDLESDKGLKLSKQSYDIREQELGWMREETVKRGTNFIDFGRDSINTHQSYYKNEEGEFVENVYQPKNEAEHDYDKAMQGLLGNIRADYTGISRGKADRIAEGLIPTYLNSTEGDQDYRKLTQIDGMSHKEALTDIRGRLQSFTDQQIHSTKAASVAKNASKMNGNGSINSGYTAISQDNLDISGYYNKVLDMNSGIFKDFENGDYSGMDKVAKDTKRMSIAQAKSSLPPEEYAQWKKHNLDLYKGHEKFGSLVNYSTTNTWQPDFETQKDMDWSRTASVAGGAGVVGAGLVAVGAAMSWNPIGWGILGFAAVSSLIGMGVDIGFQVGENGYLSEKGNVRDMMNTDQGDGALFGLLDSQSEELAANLEDTEWVNEILGTNYKNGDPVYEQLKKNAQATLQYRQEGGGDEHDDMINDYKDDIFEAETYKVDYNNTKLVNAINGIEKQYDPSDWDFVGMPEGGAAWKKMVGVDDDDRKAPDVKFRGIIAPSIDDDTPLMFKWNINGKTYLAESKENRPGAVDLEEMMAMDMNQAELVVIDRARQWVNSAEDNSSGSGRDGQPTKGDLVNVLNDLYKNIVGMSDADASAHAENYVMSSFFEANPMLQQQVVQEKYGEGKVYQQLTDQEKGFIDQELESYYKVYRNGEVR